MTRTTPLAVAALAASCLCGCYSTDGAFMPSTGRGFTYVSTPTQPVTVTLVDTRTNESFYKMDIPAGQQLTFRFSDGTSTSDSAKALPVTMSWGMWIAGDQVGSLSNQMTAPPASCRRIDITYRTPPEDPPPDPTLLLPPDVDSTATASGKSAAAPGGTATFTRPKD
ncbi:MAG: hypothetical protein FJ256_03850 [Phycisphaerae bacterium]|nr:hypothetical protein [Phycisphaerae bacterium]